MSEDRRQRKITYIIDILKTGLVKILDKKSYAWVKKVLAFFGIIVSADTKHPVHLSKRFFYWILGFFGLFILGNIVMYNYSTNPNFCRSCHIMEPYYQAWATSKHYKKAACVDCHYPPSTTFSEHIWHKFQATSQVAKYITRTYSSKPFAVVKDESCLRSGCHSKRLLEGKTETPKGVRFDHAPHLTTKRKDRQLSCTSCHSQIVIGTHIEVTYTTCYLCHFKGRGEGRNFSPLKGCKGCHEVPTKDIKVGDTIYNHTNYAVNREVSCQNCHIDVVQGTGMAPKERCVDCHNDPLRLEAYEDLEFIHEKHVTENHAACHQCHLSITHKVETTLHPSETDEINCSLCHTNTHTGQKMMYRGVGGRNVEDMPSPMYHSQVDCVGCHFDPKSSMKTSEFKGMTYAPSKLGCVQCHGEDYLEIYNMWQEGLKLSLDETRLKLAQVKALFKSKPNKATIKKWEALKDAEYNYEFVQEAHGIHNPDYAGALLQDAIKRLDEILKDSQ